ncbi:6-carboxytetrahydropterin synthase QueD [Candidatus Aerophobetes bacterium]|nr:6-carboxytetrahydropterin synthase QueD [Candidatus Aerophobetes bacterium]
MYELMVKTHFAAAHQLKEAGGGCERLHGHTWKVEVFLQGEKLDKEGMLIDFREVKRIVKIWVDKLDHQYLNETLKGINPTTENLAKYLFEGLEKDIDSERVKLSKVKVWEAEDTCVSYENRRG